MKAHTFGIIMAFLFLALPAAANDLPFKPRPQPAGKEYWFFVGAMGTAWTFDTIATHQNYVDSPYAREGGALFAGSRSTPKIMATWGAVDFGAAVLALEWKRHVHNRYLGPLWRVPMMWRSEEHARAAFGNWGLSANPVQNKQVGVVIPRVIR